MPDRWLPNLQTNAAGSSTILVPRAANRRRGNIRFLHVAGLLLKLAILAALVALIVHELQTSALQSRLFSKYAQRLNYSLATGPSASIAFPTSGPFDQNRGYTALPGFLQRLGQHGYQITEQAHVSEELASLVRRGITPPYSELPAVGLSIRTADGTVVFDAISGDSVFARFEDIPPLMVNTLLFMENRELLRPVDPRSNPVIEWDRLAKAGVLFVGAKIGLSLPLEGGSTLATQLQKFRHSPSGRTHTASDKLRQLLAASLHAYQDGGETRNYRKQVVVDYLNSMPLAATPGFGEVYGLGNGLRAWFGVELSEVVGVLSSNASVEQKADAFKYVLALLAAVRAPSEYLIRSPDALERRVMNYLDLLAQGGVIDGDMAAALRHASFSLHSPEAVVPEHDFVREKARTAVRHDVMSLLGVSSAYDLNRLDLQVESSIDTDLQRQITDLLRQLTLPEFVSAQGLTGERMLRIGNPAQVQYSLLLFERGAEGNLARVHADNLNQPFDINTGIKMELGSTAKLRTLAHYLEVVDELYRELASLTPMDLAARARRATDPITRWAAETLRADPTLDLYSMLQLSLDRRYSASPNEGFFTGGGLQSFGNFDHKDDARVLPLSEALRRSTNLVFIRLMRDLVRYHQARLPYDPAIILADQRNPQRRQLLQDIADNEATRSLQNAYGKWHGLSPGAAIDRLLGKNSRSARHLTMLYFAWHRSSNGETLSDWLKARLGFIDAATIDRLTRAYGNPRLTLSDYAYLLSRHPLDIWVAGELVQRPDLTWDHMMDRSAEPRRLSSAWLFKTRNRRAQDLRLRIRVEEDAFARMTPYWQRLGFPFARLVPSYATAIGSSADRPAALADLMGIIVNNGVRRPLIHVTHMRFAAGTPYETALQPDPSAAEPVMDLAAARVLREALAGVVESGTARRLAGSFRLPDGQPVVAGGKTGSGDNRFETYARGGGVISSRAVSRTATFVFYIGERFFGVVTAYVPGRDADGFEFTSALPLRVMQLAAPMINTRL